MRATGYLRWSGWAITGVDLITSQLDHASIIDAGRRALAEHISARTDSLIATIATTLKEVRRFLSGDEITDPVQETERQLFDLVAVTARGPLGSSTPQTRKMTARLLQLALQERPESLDHILADVLSLSDVEREELADLLHIRR